MAHVAQFEVFRSNPFPSGNCFYVISCDFNSSFALAVCIQIQITQKDMKFLMEICVTSRAHIGVHVYWGTCTHNWK